MNLKIKKNNSALIVQTEIRKRSSDRNGNELVSQIPSQLSYDPNFGTGFGLHDKATGFI